MSFANPLLLLLGIPLAFAAWRLLRHGRKSGIKFSAVPRLPAKTAGWRAKVAAMTPYLLLAGLALLVVASARPRSPLAHEHRSVDAIAIAMTMDVSGSMAALDLTPRGARFSENTTRLAVVKRLFSEFVRKRRDDMLALVTFGSYASTRAPLTADHEMLLHVLDGVTIPTERDEVQTAIGDGLAMALARLKDTKIKSRVVILLSDGDQTVSDAVSPDEAAAAAAKMGVKVYAIGIGTRSRIVPYLVRDMFGRQQIIQDQSGFDEKQLRRIAEKTGGAYYPVNDRDSLQKALDEIDQLETTKLEADAYNRWSEHYALFLLPGALLVLLSIGLSVGATRRLA